jgi:hypothetical protein
MKIIRKISIITLTVVLIAGIFTSCSLLDTVTNIKNLKFKLNGIQDFRVSGVSLSGKSKITDFGMSDAFKLSNLVQNGNSFPVQFVLDVAAFNPNDGKATPIKTDATISSMDWRLLIDDVPTITGDITSPITVPGSGQSISIPITMNLDLYQFFKDQGIDKLLNLAFALGGQNTNLSRVKLDVRPTVKTVFGPMVYPGRITIIDKDYTK